MTDTTKWIDLKDNTTKAKLKVLVLDDANGTQRTYLVVAGLAATSDRWRRAVELLNFVESPSKKYLLRQVISGEKIKPEDFRSVWPAAALTVMSRADARMELKGKASKESVAAPSQEPAQEESKDASIELGEVLRLGRNADNEIVFKSPLGRYIERRGGNVFEGSALLSPALFMRANDAEQERVCADGFVQAMNFGEVQHSGDFYRFLESITDSDGPFSPERIERASNAIDSAVMRFLTLTYQTPQDAFGDASRLYEMLPPYQGAKRGLASMPIPLSVMAQRLLGDTQGKSVVFPDAYDGAAFSFLATGTQIRAYRGGKNISEYARSANSVDVQWEESFDHLTAPAADHLFINKDLTRAADGKREDFLGAMRALKGLRVDGRAVIVLAADAGESGGEMIRETRDFYDYLARTFEVEAAFEIPAQMTNRAGSNNPIRVVSIKNRKPRNVEYIQSFPILHSWDQCKTYVDEAIIKVDLKEVESEGIDVERVALENEFQRPYIAFSKTAEATTMVPKNLQAPLQAAMSNLEYLEGAIDAYVERELQFGENTLSERFSPEQIDAIALGVHSIKQGRGPIIGDETGIGKGRTLSGLAVWANKQGKTIVFITDKANLFSDLVRDLRHIEEWGRFKPMLMNTGAVLIDGETKEVLHEGTPASEVKNIIDNMVPMDIAGYNIVFTTYSQIATEDSLKTEWLLQQVPNALFITDESHVAAGSDSNMSRAVVDLQTRAWGVVYSSATWAKSSENLHIYSRAFPPAINISTLTTTMRTGGEAFAEVFSSMLAKDGSFIRREHDLSKLEMVLSTDSDRLARNSAIADKVAEVLGAMTFVGGEINRLLMRSNNDTVSALRRAREVHGGVRAQINDERTRTRARRAQPAAPNADGTQLVDPAQPARPVTMFKASFGAGTVLYQVMRRVLAVLNADNVSDLAINALQENRKPVIVFEDTGETFVRQIMDELTIPAMDGENAIVPTHIPAPTIKDMLMKVVARMGVVQTRTVLDTQLMPRRVVRDGQEVDEEIDVAAVLNADDGTAATVSFSIENLPGMTQGQKDDYLDGMKRIIEMIERMPPLPLNAIDVVRGRLQDAGYRVGEISGRRIMLDMPDGLRSSPIDSEWDKDPQLRNWKIAYRNKTKRAVSETTFEFNNGDLDALVINRSAATGISLHSSPRFADRRRRELIEMQIPENPTDRIQLYGRVNRYDQVVGPRITMATTGVYGELRQLMMQNKKLAKLSANVRSSRDNAAEIKHVVDLLNSIGERVCERFLMDNAPIRQRLGITDAELESPNFAPASKLTSRLVLLRVSEQKMVYEELYAAYDEEVMRLDLSGKNPLKAREMDIRARVVQSRIAIGVEMDGLGSVFDGPVYMRELNWRQELRPIAWDGVKEKIKSGRDLLLQSKMASLTPMEVLPMPSIKGLSDFVVPEIEGADSFDLWDAEVATLSFSEVSSIAVPRIALAPTEQERPAEVDQIGATDDGDALAQEPTLRALVSSMGLSAVALPSFDRHAFDSAQLSDVHVTPVLESEDVKQLAVGFRLANEVYTSLDLSKSAKMLAQILGDRARLSLAGSPYPDLESAIRSDKQNSIKDMWAKKLWVERNFSMLQPGCLIGVPQGDDNFEKKKEKTLERFANLFRERVTVTALIPPPEGKEAQLSKWKVEGLVPGDEKVRQYSVSKLVEDVSLMGMLRADSVADVRLAGGPVLYGFAFSGQPIRSEYDEMQSQRNKFETAPSGFADRKAYVLEGNMYLASEWAQATKKGHGVIYSDETGARHRAIMMTQSSLYGERDLFAHLPVRLWVPSMIEGVVERLWNEKDLPVGDREVPPNFAGAGFLFKTDFASAMQENQASREGASQFLIIPEKMVALAVEKKEMTRASRAMRSEARRLFDKEHPHFKLYTAERKEEAKASAIKITTSAKKGAQSLVIIETPSVERAREAVELICRSVGLELFMWPHSKAGQMASDIQAKYFEGRRDEARLLREEARLRRESRSNGQSQEGLVTDVPAHEVDSEQDQPQQRMAA